MKKEKVKKKSKKKTIAQLFVINKKVKKRKNNY